MDNIANDDRNFGIILIFGRTESSFCTFSDLGDDMDSVQACVSERMSFDSEMLVTSEANTLLFLSAQS